MIDIYWKDLTKEKQDEILEKLGDNGNWDVIPIVEIPENECEYMQYRYRVLIGTLLHKQRGNKRNIEAAHKVASVKSKGSIYMTAIIFVKYLNKKGIYISQPCEYLSGRRVSPYRIAVYPIDNEIRYVIKSDGGFLVSGEGFVFDDDKENVAKHRKRYYTHVDPSKEIIHTMVSSEDDL